MRARAPWWLTHGGAFRADNPARRLRGVVLLVILSAAAVAALSFTAPWRLVELRGFDYLSTLSPPARPADGPIVVAIDEPSMAEIGRQWPWPRDLHGRLVVALRAAGARPIGLDVIFAEPSSEAADAGLEAALGPDVTLAADESLIPGTQADQFIRVEPLARFTATGARSGVASIALDEDGVLRRVPRNADGFARVLLETAGGSAPELPPGALLQTFGPGRTYPTVSYYQALDPGTFLPEDLLLGRTVIVGLSLQAAATPETGGADAFSTSATLRSGQLVSGAEIQAAIFDNLAHGLFITPAPRWAGLAAILVAAGLGGWAVGRETGWRTVAAAAIALAAFATASFLLLRFGRIHAGPLGPSLTFFAVCAAQGARDYAAERRLRQRITRAFAQYLSPVMVERLAADPAQLKLGGERRTLTLLFCDVRGFTTISESLKDEPERLTSLINRLLNPLSAVILRHGGTIDKYIGDAIMAFWNAPLDDPDHASHAVAAALDMLQAVDVLNAELAAETPEGQTPIALRIGVGVNTGDCVVGNMGSDLRFDYTALGDAVNLASRLEGQTKTYGVSLLLGEGTARALEASFPVAELDRVQVKGKTQAVAVFTVVPPDPEALAGHAALVADLYAGRLSPDDARLPLLAARLPELGEYYDGLAKRLTGAA